MQIQKINFGNTQVANSLKQIKSDNYYENPISRRTESNLAVLSSVGISSLVGLTAAGLTSCIKNGWKAPVIVGAGATIVSLLLNLPAKLYNTKVNAFAREKEMDVFARQKAAQSNIYSDINKEIKDDEVSLDDKIKHYSTVKMADNGNGVMIKGV